MAMTAGFKADGVVQRACAIMLRPRRTWGRIAQEPTSGRRLFSGYVMILAAINPISWTIGRLAFGERVLGAPYRPPILGALIEAVIGYLLILASVYLLALLIEHLAPPFGAAKDRLGALKVAAYSGTAGWLASIFSIVPALQPAALIGVFYGLYLLYRGIEVVMAPPPRRAFGYVVLVVVCYVVLMMLATSLTKLLAALA